jgi:dephospho-CoA kinase
MARVLVTGMSGTGKSTVLARLAERGHRVVDTDRGDWIVELPGGAGSERQWRAASMDALLAEHERSGEPLVVAGCVCNQGEFRDRFDEVVLLSAPVVVLLDRVVRRTDNPFGATEADRARIVADTAEVEPLLRRTATLEIDATRPLAEVVDLVAARLAPG